MCCAIDVKLRLKAVKSVCHSFSDVVVLRGPSPRSLLNEFASLPSEERKPRSENVLASDASATSPGKVEERLG